MGEVEVDAEAVAAFFRDSRLGLEVYAALAATIGGFGPVAVRVSRSQVAFRRGRGFCWEWLPGRYLRRPTTEVVVSIALPQRDTSHRWKEVVEVRPHQWMHHLEVHTVGDLDEEVERWLARAYRAAG
jgi:hypothetical protein